MLSAAAYFTKQGWIVSIPVDDFGEYDLIIDNNNPLCGKNNLLKVQVKTAYWDNSKKRYIVSLVTSHIRGKGKRYNKKYNLNSFHRLVAIEPENGFIYQWSIDEVAGKRSITVYPNKEYELNRNTLY